MCIYLLDLQEQRLKRPLKQTIQPFSSRLTQLLARQGRRGKAPLTGGAVRLQKPRAGDGVRGLDPPHLVALIYSLLVQVLPLVWHAEHTIFEPHFSDLQSHWRDGRGGSAGGPRVSRGDNKDSRHPSQAQGTSGANNTRWGIDGGHKANSGHVLPYRSMSKQAS